MRFQPIRSLLCRLALWGVGALAWVVVPTLRAQSLLAYYSLDASTLTLDGSSHITNATGVGGTLGLINGAYPSANSSGRFGEAINFSAGRLDTSNFAGGSTALGNSFSISFWMNVSTVATTPQSYVFQIGDPNGAQTAVIYGYTAGRLELFSPDITGATNVSALRTASAINLSSGLVDTWINVIYVYDGTTLSGYVNGSQAFSTNLSFSLTADGGLSIGGSRNPAMNATNYFAGSLDDVAIYSGAFSAGQIADLQNTTALFAIPEPATWSAVCGVAVLGLAFWRRRTRAAG